MPLAAPTVAVSEDLYGTVVDGSEVAGPLAPSTSTASAPFVERSQYTKWKTPEKSSVRVSVMRTSPLGMTRASTATLVMEKPLAAAGPAARAAPAATTATTTSASSRRSAREGPWGAPLLLPASFMGVTLPPSRRDSRIGQQPLRGRRC